MKQNCKRSCNVCGGKLRKLHLNLSSRSRMLSLRLNSFLNPRNRLHEKYRSPSVLVWITAEELANCG